MKTETIQTADLKTQLANLLSGDLAAVNAILRRRLQSSSDFVSDVTEHVSRFQGKQIRPILLLLFERAIAGHSSECGKTLAAAVEMIHTATLVHDDVIDEAETRRHVATVHRRWNTETSVLLGDYLFSKSFHMAASTGDAEACRLIGLATDRTCEGELNQTAARLQRSKSEFDYFRIIRDKTGQLFGLSCLLGARSADGSLQQQRAARRFGIRLGLAFQIADDILDLTETASSTGKDEGNDLQNGRLTLPLLRAFRNASEYEANELLAVLENDADDRRTALNAMPCIQAGIRSAQQSALQLVERAQNDLACLPDSPERSLLQMIAGFAVQRQH